MKSMYARYCEERENKFVLENDLGFVKYSFGYNEIEVKHCYIEIVFTLKESREKHVAAELADQVAEIARKEDCLFLYGSVEATGNDRDRSIKVLHAYGMEFSHLGDNIMFFKKGL